LLSVESWQLRAGRDRAAGPPRAQRCHLGGRGGQLRLVPLGGRSFGLAITSQTTRRPSCVSGGRWVRQWGACTARDLGPCVPVSLRAPLPKGRRCSRCSSAASGWRDAWARGWRASPCTCHSMIWPSNCVSSCSRVPITSRYLSSTTLSLRSALSRPRSALRSPLSTASTSRSVFLPAHGYDRGGGRERAHCVTRTTAAAAVAAAAAGGSRGSRR
jgi:hypothetical protein